jgi:hemerythrin-like domain-containing protein
LIYVNVPASDARRLGASQTETMAMQKKSSTSMRSAAKAATPAAKRTQARKHPAKGIRRHHVVSALYAEHGYAARLLDLLEEQQAALSRGQPIDREAALGAMTYMTQHNDAYHHPREDAMFARLAKRDPRLVTRIAEIERAHRTIGSAGKQLLAALQRLEEGSRAAEVGVASRMGDYVGAMREHMVIEERDLFPRARQVLDDDDLATIDRAFRRVTDPIFEASVRDAYAAYSPVVRYLAEQPALRQALGVLDAFYESASRLGDIRFGGVTGEAPGASKKQLREEDAREASH